MNEMLMYFLFYKKKCDFILFLTYFLTCEWAICDLHFVQYLYYFKP